MITGCSQSFLDAVTACTYDRVAGCLRDANGVAKYPAVVRTLTPGWAGEWTLLGAGYSCSYDTYRLLSGATEVTSPIYWKGCFKTTGAVTYQLSVSAGAALPGDPPPPPPP